MRACIVHHSLNTAGGGERVCLAAIEALKSLGHEVTLITTEPTDWGRVEKMIGWVARPDVEVSVLPFRVQTFGIYMRLLTSLKLMGSRGACDLIVNTHGDALPISLDIMYMHFPTFAVIKETPSSAKYSKSLFWRAYFIPYERMQSYLARRMKWRVLLTNSEFSREAIRKHVGADAIVLPPPVDINEFLRASGSRDREDRVVLCGRYTPEKNYEFALRVAREMPDIEFTIIGAYSGKVSSSYYSKLARIKEALGLRNVRLLRNVPRSDQVRIYSKSKVFMHAMVGEHFGIAVVEGMAAGLVPVVPKSGGPWLDIVDRGRYGLGYSSLEEAVEAVEEALKNYNNYSTRAIKRALIYSRESFIKRFIEVIESVTSEN